MITFDLYYQNVFKCISNKNALTVKVVYYFVTFLLICFKVKAPGPFIFSGKCVLTLVEIQYLFTAGRM